MSKPRRFIPQPSFDENSKTRRQLWIAAALAFALAASAGAQEILPSRGVDSRVDYPSLTRFGPWDDRNYELTAEDLALLADDEDQLTEAIPAFYRVHLRQVRPGMRRSGPAQYPRSALPMFRVLYGGYLIEGKVYTHATRENGRFVVDPATGVDAEDFFAQKALDGEARVTSPNGAAESAIAFHPSNTNRVIAGSNGPGSGQKMHYSTDGGTTWSPAAALPLGGHCCDPTVAWSSDGAKAYTATLGSAVWFYRSGDNGATWNDLGADPRRELGSNVDKEYLHVDHSPTSPHLDNIYLTWHQNNVMKFARSTNRGNTWSSVLTLSGGGENGIGSDITSDPAGNVYYFWPAFDSRKILMRKSTNGGTSFQPTVDVASTAASYDFPVPSMESRRVFVYVSADADHSGGPFDGSLYAAWTDSTAATGNNAANNHARIRVAYSRNGGASWTVKTPHETGDANSVDRWHQWLAVADNGTVHVIFYDTRRDPSRSSVDLFHSSSADGGQTWSAPLRLTSEQSPNINDSFEFGDYNGLDVVMNDLIAVYTDNRREGGGSGDSVDVYAVGTSVGDGGNSAPEVTITAPANGATVDEGTAIGFAGSATDAEDGNLTASLAWTSSRDGAIGSGGSFSAVLSAGTHTVTAAVTDSGGLSDSAAITVTVTEASTCGDVLREDFESGASGWRTFGLWHLVDDSPCASPGYSSPTGAMYYGQDASCDYDTGGANSGNLFSPTLDGITADSVLRFQYFRQVEADASPIADKALVAVRPIGGSWSVLWSRDSRHASENAWTASGDLSLAAFAGQSIQMVFQFRTIDGLDNAFTGWLIDDVEVSAGGSCSAPAVTITSPADGASIPAGTAISFAATASDADDGDLTAGLGWTSSLDGAIGSGGSFSTTLSPGSHTVTAAVTDSDGLTGSDAIAVTITEASCEGFREDFEGEAGGWRTFGLWHLVDDSPCASPGYSSPTGAMYYGQDASCDYDTGGTNSGNLFSPTLDGITADSVLRFQYFRQVEEVDDPIVDKSLVAVRPAGGSWTVLWKRDSRHASENAWTASGDLSLAAFAGQSIQVLFQFKTIDEIFNDFTGWLVDDVEVVDGSCAAVTVDGGEIAGEARRE